jgi:hypothetical protein
MEITMTPRKAAKIRKAAWQTALNEGRVIKFNGGETFKSYLTVEQANKALGLAISAGLSVEIVKVGE